MLIDTHKGTFRDVTLPIQGVVRRPDSNLRFAEPARQIVHAGPLQIVIILDDILTGSGGCEAIWLQKTQSRSAHHPGRR